MQVDVLELELAPGVSLDLRDSRALAHRLLIVDTLPSDADMTTAAIEALSYELLPDWYDDWVVIEGSGREAGMTVKLALVDRSGPPAGTRVDIAAPLGRPQWVEAEHPGAGRFVHIELLKDGQQIDPRSVMRERKAQDVAK